MSQSKRLDGRIAIVTGASSGIGRAIAIRYAKEGAKVVVADLNEKSRTATEESTTADEVNKLSDGLFVKVDVTNPLSVKALVEQTVAKYHRLDIYVNNAGILEDGVPIWEMSDDHFNRAIDVNGKGCFHGIREASAQMIKQDPHPSGDRGWIINMASVYGLIAAIGCASYVASKHLVSNLEKLHGTLGICAYSVKVMGLTKTAALDLAPHRVHVNAINPGYVNTRLMTDIVQKEFIPMVNAGHPFRGVGEPADIEGIAVFLASDDARWMSGSHVVADGCFSIQ